MPDAAIALIRRADARLLCVWNQRYGCWAFPGGLVEQGETILEGLMRELREETGMRLRSANLMYRNRHNTKIPEGRGSVVHVFLVEAEGEPREMEVGSPVTWFTVEQFLKWTAFSDFYRQMFQEVGYVRQTHT